jgi:uncharacterized protein
MTLRLRLLAGDYSWVSFPPRVRVDMSPLIHAEFWMCAGDETETTWVGPKTLEPDGGEVSGGWRMFEIVAELSHELTGIAAAIANPLADANVQIMPVAAYRTDYVGVNGERVEQAVAALRGAGFEVNDD